MMGKAIVALCVALGAAASVAASQSPFEGGNAIEGVTTSNDAYGVWLYWEPQSGLMRVPGFEDALDVEATDLTIAVMLACRADGRDAGYSGPERLRGELVLPMHPDAPNVPNVYNPLYWWWGLTGREWHRTPVTVQWVGGAAREGELLRHRIDYSIPRPAQSVELDPAEILALLQATTDATLRVMGTGTGIVLRFAPRPDRAGLAALIETHCLEMLPGQKDTRLK